MPLMGGPGAAAAAAHQAVEPLLHRLPAMGTPAWQQQAPGGESRRPAHVEEVRRLLLGNIEQAVDMCSGPELAAVLVFVKGIASGRYGGFTPLPPMTTLINDGVVPRPAANGSGDLAYRTARAALQALPTRCPE